MGSICFEQLENGKLCVEIYDCEHSFHKECIDKWSQKSNTCPNCRSNIINVKCNSFDKECIKNMSKIPNNLHKYIDMWPINCIRNNHNVFFRKVSGVIGICEDCDTIMTFNDVS